MRANQRPAAISKHILVSLLVIALTTVIAVKGSSAASVASDQQQQQQQVPSASSSGESMGAKVGDDPKQQASLDSRKDASQSATAQAIGDSQQQESQAKVNADAAAKSPELPSVAARSSADRSQEASPDVPVAQTSSGAQQPADSGEVSKRKGRAEPTSGGDTATGKLEAKQGEKESPTTTATEKSTEKPGPVAPNKIEPKSQPKPGKSGSQQLSAKSGQVKPKIPANLGTVTSTGSGGPAHYMSKHDAYSAIAEKHGALAQDSLRQRTDKRHGVHGFSGIQKASGFSDMLSPFKGVTDSGLARTLGASMRSIMKSKYSVPAYVASALLGAVALMAFYESPISPLPVPPLPEPPVGRFPPEMPVISPNAQIPYRTNQQQGYNQRSLNLQPANGGGYQASNQQSQQVLFPMGNNNAMAQQRQAQGNNNQASLSGPAQLAANLLSVGKQQSAQRKSSPDYDQSSSRSFFGSSIGSSLPKISSQSNQQQQLGQKQASSGFLSLFGLGGSSSSDQQMQHSGQQMGSSTSSGNNAPASGLAPAASNSIQSQSSLIEPKGQSSGLSNSHLVNKVKSFFSRSSSPASSSGSGAANSYPYDQYQRMSFVQALMKDTAFLPGFFTQTRKSSPSSATSGAKPSSASSSSSSSSASSGSAGNNLQGANLASRMQVSSDGSQLASVLQMPLPSKQRQASSGNGLMRAADRIAHALIETFTSGIVQRSAPVATSSSADGRKSSEDQSNQSSPSSLASATSLLSDIVSSYSSNVARDQQFQQHTSEQVQAKTASQQQQSQHNAQQQQQGSQQVSDSSRATGRTADNSPVIITEEEHHSHQEQPKQQSPASSSATSNGNKQPASSDAALVRKTRSIGLEYPTVNQQDLMVQQPSKAAQINNVIDYVVDSYTQNRLLFNFVMNQVGLSQAVPYVEQILAPGSEDHH